MHEHRPQSVIIIGMQTSTRRRVMRTGTQKTECRELTIAELERVAGGFPLNAVGGGFVDVIVQVAEKIVTEATTYQGSPCGR
jgi:hypothetical protein